MGSWKDEAGETDVEGDPGSVPVKLGRMKLRTWRFGFGWEEVVDWLGRGRKETRELGDDSGWDGFCS